MIRQGTIKELYMEASNPPEGLRINKAMAGAGFCSRREADLWISAGEVRVNGQVENRPGRRLLPGDVLEARGRVFTAGEGDPAGHTYLALHKPAEVVSTLRDPQGRRTVRDLLPAAYAGKRLFPVGRLDFFSEGLLLMTDDGELTRRLTHPRFHVPKIYELLARGEVEEGQLALMRAGMTLAEGEVLAPVLVERNGKTERGELLRLTLRQGLNRQIRRMCRDLGLTVLRLRRVGQGSLRLGALASGACRELTPEETLALKREAGLV
jgi:23S rRNA pseudouridine2605 synthase